MRKTPDISEAYLKLQSLNPLYRPEERDGAFVDEDTDRPVFDLTADIRARMDKTAVLYDKNGKAGTHNGICKKLSIYEKAIESRASQMENNKFWREKGPVSLENFYKAPRTFIKTIMEVFSNPADYFIVNRDELNITTEEYHEIIDAIIIEGLRS